MVGCVSCHQFNVVDVPVDGHHVARLVGRSVQSLSLSIILIIHFYSFCAHTFSFSFFPFFYSFTPWILIWI